MATHGHHKHHGLHGHGHRIGIGIGIGRSYEAATPNAPSPIGGRAPQLSRAKAR